MAKRILVVDDDADFQEAIDLILGDAGYEVTKAYNARQAMDRLRSEPFDLILLDVMMETDTEGFHLAYQIRENPKLRDTPIVIMTCIEQTTGVGLELEKAGDFLPVDAYLRKPVDAELLKETVAKLVGRQG